jgi:nicotinate-nucleotide pyrophosphorylase (carboxylating)
MLRRALAEDGGGGDGEFGHDRTSRVAVPVGARARGRLVAKQVGCLAGIEVFARVFELLDPEAQIERLVQDGAGIRPGLELLRLEGDARALLFGERTALNCLQRMSGIATVTARYVELSAGRARILDTRKTTPTLRAFEKYAVRCGGGENHRFGLFDEVMLKNNHVDLAQSSVRDLLVRLRADVGDGFRITAEARDEREALEGVAGGADVVMLDNFDPDGLRAVVPALREAARERGRPLEIEASGGIDEGNLEAYAATGVDRLSIGALTHSAPALDLSLYLEPIR